MGAIHLHVTAFAVLITLGALAVGGADVGIAAMAGGLVAIVNWLLLRWVADRIIRGTMRQKAMVTVVLSLKLAAIGAVCFVLIVKVGLMPIGFLLGVTALMLGVFSGALVQQLRVVREEG